MVPIPTQSRVLSSTSPWHFGLVPKPIVSVSPLIRKPSNFTTLKAPRSRGRDMLLNWKGWKASPTIGWSLVPRTAGSMTPSPVITFIPLLNSLLFVFCGKKKPCKVKSIMEDSHISSLFFLVPRASRKKWTSVVSRTNCHSTRKTRSFLRSLVR